MRALIVFFVLLTTLIVAGCAQYDEQNAPETEMTTPEDTDETTADEEMEVIDTIDEAQSEEHEVLIEDFKFKPATLQISIGDTVKWINMDSAPHTATSNDKGFDSGRLLKDESFSFTFEEEGTFDYICTYHPYMEGEITVEA
ncbi:cupredoxin domain-containing protein [Methanococcoides methylutens]|uniref:cupredoxin domain-containing protein n=1 Tax=Methanococcoides methylutens TaxID=2226 RepID=UPI00404397F5